MTITMKRPRLWRGAAPSPERDDDPLVMELTTTPLVTISWDAGLATALQLMVEHGVRHLPVFDRTRCRGLLLEADVVDHLVSGAPVERWWQPVAGFVRPAPEVATTARRSEAARAMRDAGTDAALITEEGRLVGLVTATDLARSLRTRHAETTAAGKSA